MQSPTGELFSAIPCHRAFSLNLCKEYGYWHSANDAGTDAYVLSARTSIASVARGVYEMAPYKQRRS
ncbi:hypothetical protein BN2476_300086 [Paraburkholderia piptadeniae]|uniref:Uncharacterized protein n=1 Tax=Paraburkholderia piptadeniae TaxID=1701573 RepID=A0A1N7S2P1_9BURK|nr:hypothetical protein BN2476_300086 [Paraburkholderia piptadeniae]